MSEPILDKISPVRCSSKKAISFRITVSYNFYRKLIPSLSLVQPKIKSRQNEAIAVAIIITNHCHKFLSTAAHFPVDKAVIIRPIKLGKRKSAKLPTNMKGRPSKSRYFCSQTNTQMSLLASYSIFLSLFFWDAAFDLACSVKLLEGFSLPAIPE